MSILSTIEHSTQRKYTLIHGTCKDHAGSVQITPIKDFDLDATIFKTLSGKIPRLFIKAKVAKKVQWEKEPDEKIRQEYQEMKQNFDAPRVDENLLQFMTEECDFSIEHADGSFLEHLVYGYEYALRFYPQHSALVMLLHSILGTGSNTFAMENSKIPSLRKLLTEFEFTHIAAFPSFLRLMYEPTFFTTILNNKDSIDTYQGIRFHRVIDNLVMELSIEDLWIQLNYHLIHMIDFLPVANWQTHQSDPLIQICIQLIEFLDQMGQRQVQIEFPIPTTQFARPVQETLSMGSRLSNWIPASIKMKLATKSIRKFSEQIGHSLHFELIR